VPPVRSGGGRSHGAVAWQFPPCRRACFGIAPRLSAEIARCRRDHATGVVEKEMGQAPSPGAREDCEQAEGDAHLRTAFRPVPSADAMLGAKIRSRHHPWAEAALPREKGLPHFRGAFAAGPIPPGWPWSPRARTRTRPHPHPAHPPARARTWPHLAAPARTRPHQPAPGRTHPAPGRTRLHPATSRVRTTSARVARCHPRA
jgi:hypothetical protein